MRENTGLISRYPRATMAAVLVMIVLALLVAWANRPLSPEQTVRKYVATLSSGDCAGAYKLISAERRDDDPDVESLDSFKEHVCDQVSSYFDKFFIAPDSGISEEVVLDDAKAEFFLCVLPKDLTRRICTRHEARLKREGSRWRIFALDIGLWSNTHEVGKEKKETLIPDYSNEKRP